MSVTVADLLAQLRMLDVQVALEGDRLRLNAPAGMLTDQMRTQLESRKQEIVDFLQSVRQLSLQQSALVPLTPLSARLPIFAAAGHNGDVFCYRALAHHLGPEQPFFGLQPPGLEEGSDIIDSVEGLASHFADQIREFYTEGPLTIAGFCAGGTVAFELARQLATSGVDVRNLVLFGAPYPASYRRMSRLTTTVGYLVHRSIVHAHSLITLPAEERRRYFADRLKVLRREPQIEPDDPVLIRRSNVENATMTAVARYDPRPFDIHLDLMLPNAAWTRSSDAPLRWKDFGTTSAEYIGAEDCNGDNMLLAEHAPRFATLVKQAQERAVTPRT